MLMEGMQAKSMKEPDKAETVEVLYVSWRSWTYTAIVIPHT